MVRLAWVISHSSSPSPVIRVMAESQASLRTVSADTVPPHSSCPAGAPSIPASGSTAAGMTSWGGAPRHPSRVLAAALAATQRFFRSRQLFQLPGCLQVLGRRTGGQLAMRAQPRHHAQRPVSPVAARLLEAASRLAVDRRDPVDDLATLDDRRAELAPRLLRQPARQIPDRRLDPLEGRLAGTAHGASMRRRYDSCLS